MANKKIIQLTTNSLPLLTGYTIYDDGITTYKTSIGSLKTAILSGATNNISGSQNQLALFSGYNSLTSSWFTHINNQTLGLGTSQYNERDPERLVVDNDNSFNIATFQTTKNDSWGELNVKNLGSGSYASADVVIWNDVSTEDNTYVDLGLNSSNYTAGWIGFQSDGYLYTQGGDLYVGSTSNGQHGHLHLFGGNLWTSSSISIYNDGTVGFGTDWLNNDAVTIPSSTDGFTYEFSGNVKLQNELKIDGSIYVQGTLNMGQTTEKIYSLEMDGNSVTLDFLYGSIFYLTNATSNFSVNMSNIPDFTNKGIKLTFMIEQSLTPYLIDELIVNDSTVPIFWSGGTPPTGNGTSVDVMSFNLLNVNGTIKALGNLITFG